MLRLRDEVLNKPSIRATELNRDEMFSTSSEELELGLRCEPAVEATYLLEPGIAIQKAELAEVYAAQFGLKQAGKAPVYFLGDAIPADWVGRKWRILEILPVHWKKLKKYFSEMELDKAMILRKHFTETTHSIKEKLKIREGGVEYLVFLEGNDGQKRCYRCERQ